MSNPNPDGETVDQTGQTDEETVFPALGDQLAESDGSSESDVSGGLDEPTGSGDPDTATGVTDPSVRNGYHRQRSEDLESEIAALRTENDSLRSDYARAQKAMHRRTALALAAIGVIAALGGIAFPDVRALLFVTGAIGLFGGVLTWYLTPERVVPIGVSESVYDATASTLRGMRDELGLQSLTVYVPVDDRVRGFVPRHRAFELPESPRRVFVTDDGVSRGVSFPPTGQRLADEFDRIRRTQPSADAGGTVEQIGETLIEHFEIAGDVEIERSADASEITVSVQDAAFGSVARVDHPVVSTLACGVVRATQEPVTVEAVDETTVVFDTAPRTGAGSS